MVLPSTRNALTMLVLLVPLVAAHAQAYRVNCGGNQVLSAGQTWSADRAYGPGWGYGYVGGAPLRPQGAPIGGTPYGENLRDLRRGLSAYRFDVAAGDYTVHLRFVENQLHGPGLRRQSISAEGTLLVDDVDVAELVGKDYACERGYRVQVTDGALDLAFTASVGEPAIHAIAVIPTPPDGAGPPPPPGFQAYGIFGANLISWVRGNQPDLDGYRVRRRTSPGGPATVIATPTFGPARFIDRTAQIGVQYFYDIVGVDVFGNAGPPTPLLPAVALPDAATPLRIYELDIDPLDQLFLDIDPWRDVYVPAVFGHDSYVEPIARTRYRGNIGRLWSKKSYNVRVDAVPFEGRRKIILKSSFNDWTLLKERFGSHLLTGTSIETYWTRYAHLHRSGEDAGVFIEIESVDQSFLDRHGLDENADLYKTSWGANMYPLAGPIDYARHYEKQTNTHADSSLLIDLIETMHVEPVASLDVMFASRMDVQRVLDHYAAVMLIADLDYTQHNYYLYRNSSSGLFHLLPWDKDVSMYGPTYPLTGGTESEPPGTTIGGPNRLYSRLMEVPLFRAIFVDKLQEMIATIYSPPATGAVLAQDHMELLLDAQSDYRKIGWEDNGGVLGGAGWLAQFVVDRINFLNPQLPGFTAPVPRPLLINEVLARNRSTLADGAGEFDDWIELVNTAGSPVDAGGYFLTDDIGVPTKWMIPVGTTIPAGGKLLIWADDDAVQGPLHATFQVAGAGEGLALFAPLAAGNGLVDLVGIDRQRPDISFGRRIDGGALFDELPTPTPGAPNTTAGDAPPVIWGESLDPPTPQDGMPVVVRVQVDDDLGAVASVLASHDSGGGAQQQAMADDGLGADRFGADSEYTVELPAAPALSVVRFWFDATDASLHTATDPEAAPADAHAYGVPATRGCLLLNEVCASNDRLVADGAGDFDDWIEIYNAGVVPRDVGGMFLTDDLTDTTRWAIPVGTQISAQGRLLVWADDEPLEGSYHATFRLSSRGDSVGLFDTFAAGNALIDCVTFGQQASDWSLARDVDGGSTWIGQATPTPATSNGPGPPCCPATMCGDCDLDGDIDVLDALAAAQHSLAIITLVDPGLSNCDVNASPGVTVVDVLDALAIAQSVVGLPVVLDCCP